MAVVVSVMFARNWRIYKIFYNPKIEERVSSAKVLFNTVYSVYLYMQYKLFLSLLNYACNLFPLLLLMHVILGSVYKWRDIMSTLKLFYEIYTIYTAKQIILLFSVLINCFYTLFKQPWKYAQGWDTRSFVSMVL